MCSHICPSRKRDVGAFATERSNPAVGTVEPSVGETQLLENKPDLWLKLFTYGNWRLVDA